MAGLFGAALVARPHRQHGDKAVHNQRPTDCQAKALADVHRFVGWKSGHGISDDQAVAIGDAGISWIGRMAVSRFMIEGRVTVTEIDPPFDLRIIRRHLANELEGAAIVLLKAKHAEPRGLAFDLAVSLAIRHLDFAPKRIHD